MKIKGQCMEIYVEKFHESIVKYTITTVDFSFFFFFLLSKKDNKFDLCPFSNEEIESWDD